MDVAQVKATISRGNRAAEDGERTMRSVTDRIEQAYSLAAATAHDSAHEQVTATMRRLREALKEAYRVNELLKTGAKAATNYSSSLG